MLDTDEAATVLIIEDNDPVRRFIDSSLKDAGFETVTAATGRQAFDHLRNEIFDLVLLDLKLPDVDGMDVLKTIRRQDEDMPVIIVSSLQEVDTKVLGFEIGCDDYLTKPFHVPELIGRVRRLLRRVDASAGGVPAGSRPEQRTIQDRFEVGPFEVDLRRFRVSRDGKVIEMRKKLFDLFLSFARHPNVVISKETLHQRAWDYHQDMSQNSLYVHMHQLRTLIEEDPSKPRYLKTVRGVGFVFLPDGTE
jgi:two-component system, OmpR family, alkaline phosphatase synthesis response regulator PhoP